MNLLTLAFCQSLVLYASFSHSQSITPSDTTHSPYPAGAGPDSIVLAVQGAPPGVRSIWLANLTQNGDAKLGPTDLIRGSPVVVTASTYSNELASNNIAIIQCDPSAYFVSRTSYQVLSDAVQRSVRAVVLFSNTTKFCTLNTTDENILNYAIYTMTASNAWESLRGRSMFGPAPSSNYIIARKAVADNSTNNNGALGGSNNNNGYGPSGPSPSTAVAMIILYSITGVITALFLVIIITGAIRAHRHPERYGPRNVLGRPRQSRARGIARAMLDTLPIVKFGDKEEEHAKPSDVELASGSGPAATGAETREMRDGTVLTGTEPVDNTRERDATAGAENDGKDITAAGGVAKQKAHEATPSNEDNSLGCSICTEDFERGQDVRVLPCKHSFHPACIDPWLLNVSGTCPLCRIDLRPDAAQNPESPTTDSNTLPPPLEGGELATDRRASRRFSGFLDVLNPRRMAQASPEERLEALRNVQQQRAAGSNPAEEMETRRRRRLTARLGETFGIRTRPRGPSPSPSPEPPRTGTAGGSHQGSSTQIGTITESPHSPVATSTAAAPASSSHGAPL
ncbi:hypothetical protein EJ08DRAFT_658813 [Tothia fuscella]|uniref:RING-type E3 ubiquitin transferase n=1 Tax=Tothia fuscella TaxID=1048955 RepID=A0A9P4NV22_9PEZI|nr:hypothetical protein EJ08DRAFT_658813 [Tothia fuscella]